MQDYVKELYFSASRKGSKFLLQWFRTYNDNIAKTKKVKTIKERTLNGSKWKEME